MSGSGSQYRRRFVWQAMGILLPVLVLAGWGIYSLRQDWLLADLEAEERAQSIAQTVATQVTSEIISPVRWVTQPFHWRAVDQYLAEFWAAPERPDRDPVWRYNQTSNSVQVCLLDDQGELLYPPPKVDLPTPAAFDLEELTPAQRESWNRIRLGTLAGVQSGQPDASSNGPTLASEPEAWIQAGREFIQTRPPPRFRAAAGYALGDFLAQANQIDAAVAAWDRVTQEDPGARTESGLPFGQLAQLHAARLRFREASDQEAKEQALDKLCTAAVLHPNLLSQRILEEARDLEEQTQVPGEALLQRIYEWKRLWQAHERSRQLYRQTRAWLKNPQRFPQLYPWLHGDETWMFSRIRLADSKRDLLLARKKSDLENQLARYLANESGNLWMSIPDYMGVKVQLNDRSLIRPDGFQRQLAVHRTQVGASHSPELGLYTIPQKAGYMLEVTVYLTDPDAFYARQRQRAWGFGSLIGVSTIAALIGFVAAWRGFNRQQRLNELKSDFISSVSHELRAPIASIRLMAEGLERGKVQTPKKQSDYFRFISRECRRLSSLIENVLDFSRIEQGRKQYDWAEADVTRLVKETVQLMEPYAAERNIGMETVLPDEETVAVIDARALQQALLNLIDNAIKYSPEWSRVIVGLESVSADEATSAPEHGLLRFWVEDQGKGIPQEEQHRIFERFYRVGSELHRESQGTGIGLSLVKHIVEAHQGSVSVRSTVGQGSRFEIILPKGQCGDHRTMGP